MAAMTDQERRVVERRRTPDRRWIDSRRTGAERRKSRNPVPAERRSGFDRRARGRAGYADRRTNPGRRFTDRRRQTPLPYSREETARVRELVAKPGIRRLCPACGGELSIGPTMSRGASTAREVRCPSCRRGVMVNDCAVARILLIEDERIVRDTLGIILTKAGHDVVEAEDGDAALDMYRQRPADVVLMNVAMRSIDGPDCIRRMKKEFIGVKIVAMAGPRRYGGPDPLAMARSIGVDQVLRKPFTPSEMLRVLEAARVGG